MSIPEGKRRKIPEPFIRGMLQQPRDLTRFYDAVYASTKLSRGERTLGSPQSRTRGTSGSLEHLPGYRLRKHQEFYGRGGV